MPSLELSGLPNESDDELLASSHSGDRTWMQRNRGRVVGLIAALLLVGFVAAGIVMFDATRAVQFPVPEKFSADFVAVSKANSSRTWNGGVHKTVGADGTWQLSGRAAVKSHGTQQETFTFVNNLVYSVVTHVGSPTVLGSSCLDATQSPEVAAVQTGVKNSVSLEKVALNDGAVSACGSQPKWLATYGGMSYVMCYFPAEQRAVVITDSVDITLFNINTDPAAESPYTVPNDKDGNPIECSTAGRRLGTGGGGGGGCEFSFPSCNMELSRRRRMLRTESRALSIDGFSSKGSDWYMPDRFGPSGVTCLFVHGAGVNMYMGTGWDGADWNPYWGNLRSMLRNSRCEHVKFVQVNTELQRWDDPDVSRAFCDKAVNSFGDNIYETVMFTHGMGNLIAGHALKSGLCHAHIPSFRWVELQGSSPMGRVTDWAKYICQSWSYFATNTIVQALQADVGLCNLNSASVDAYPSLLSMSFDEPAITDDLAKFIKQHINAAECSVDSYGLAGSSYLYILATPYNSPAVEEGKPMWSTCWDSDFSSDKGITFFPSASSPFSHGYFNYLDATCRNGNGAYGDDRQPCSYILNMANSFAMQLNKAN